MIYQLTCLLILRLLQSSPMTPVIGETDVGARDVESNSSQWQAISSPIAELATCFTTPQLSFGQSHWARAESTSLALVSEQ